MSIETNSQTTGRRGDDDFGTPPQSRVEQALMNEQIKPQSRIEKLIFEGGGGGGGTTDYNQLNHKPSINGTILIGNKMLSDLGIEWIWRGTRQQYEAVAATIPPNTFVDITDEPDMDNVPTQGSLNPVTSNGLYAELSKLKVINENPENHNGIYRGKDLTNVYTIEQIYERVHDGSFEDLYLGDYFTVHLTTDLMTRFTGAAFVAGTTYYEMDSGTDVTQRTWTVTQDSEPQEGKVYATKQVVEEDVDYMIAGFDIFLHTGHTIPGDSNIHLVTYHHLVIIPKTDYKTSAKMHNNATDLTGYANSDMNQITIPCYAESTKRALNSHLLPRVARLSAAVNPDIPSSAGAGYMGAVTSALGTWIYGALMSDIQLFGTTVLSSSFYEVGLDYERFPIFQFITPVETFDAGFKNRTWLRTFGALINGVVYYATYSGGGSVNFTGVPDGNTKVRPYFLFG